MWADLPCDGSLWIKSDDEIRSGNSCGICRKIRILCGRIRLLLDAYVRGSREIRAESEGGETLGFDVTEIPLDEKRIVENLKVGNPVVAVMGPGDFTTTGHYIVLCGIDSQNMVTIRDPNSRERSERKWRLDELMPQIKNLWSYHL